MEDWFLVPFAFKGNFDYLIRTKNDEVVCCIEAKGLSGFNWKNALRQTIIQLSSLSHANWCNNRDGAPRKIAILSNGLKYAFIQMEGKKVAVSDCMDVHGDFDQIVELLEVIFGSSRCLRVCLSVSHPQIAIAISRNIATRLGGCVANCACKGVRRCFGCVTLKTRNWSVKRVFLCGIENKVQVCVY